MQIVFLSNKNPIFFVPQAACLYLFFNEQKNLHFTLSFSYLLGTSLRFKLSPVHAHTFFSSQKTISSLHTTKALLGKTKNETTKRRNKRYSFYPFLEKKKSYLFDLLRFSFFLSIRKQNNIPILFRFFPCRVLFLCVCVFQSFCL